ncbi:hypothetical protein MKZ38_004097 [Zalerion maritima]|uniref:Uncharacterized protein n=1 Tax=Zalerion maritima TaxID=339359 RepID=A0AAD5RYQ1_9PEZI|nr:hypothetical protein MKZ38_004097 [Zalerion maritima]
MVGPDGFVSPSPSQPRPSSSTPYLPQGAPQRSYAPPSRSKGKEPARGRSRFRELDDNIIEPPPRAYPYNNNVDRLHTAPSHASAATAPTPSATPGPSSSNRSSWRESVPKPETIGNVLADIANCVNDTIQMFQLADHRHWGSDEEEQERRLEETLDEAAKDFQGLALLVNGQFYYEKDRNLFSVAELSQLSELFHVHHNTFHEWLRSGGPINPLWATETAKLRKALHRAQCRAAGRIFSSAREESHRCLGAHLVKRAGPDVQRLRRDRQSLASIPEQERSSLSSIPDNNSRSSLNGSIGLPGSVEEQDQVAACNMVGKFERFGDQDIAFVCDYCDGYIVWEDLSAMSSTRLKRSAQEQAREHRRSRDRDSLISGRRGNRGPRELILPRYHAEREQQLVSMDASSRSSVTTSSEPGTRSSILSDTPTTTSATSTLIGEGGPNTSEYNWMASGISFSSAEDPDPNSDPVEKTIVFAPIAISNHVPPEEGEWQARLLCPYCDDYVMYTQGDDEMEVVKYAQDENGFESLEELRQHLAWYHAPGYLESISSPVKAATGGNSCVVM